MIQNALDTFVINKLSTICSARVKCETIYRFGTTLLELCFYSYDAKSAVRHKQFHQLCRKEFKRRCNKNAISKSKINLFYCDRIAANDLKGFLTQLTAEVVHEKMSNKIHLN